MLDRIGRLSRVGCLALRGAFYACMNVLANFGRTLRGKLVSDSTSCCMAALSEAK